MPEVPSWEEFQDHERRIVALEGAPPDPPPPDPDPPTTFLPALITEDYEIPAGEVHELPHHCVVDNANIIVRGVLRGRGSGDVLDPTRLEFVNVDERTFSDGGGMEFVAEDKGLWVLDGGQLDLQGTPKVGWNRTGADPSWSASDELRLAPWQPGDYGRGVFDRATKSYPRQGFESWLLNHPPPRYHDSVLPTEVLNLSRDLVIQGGDRPNRPHVIIMSSAPQIIKHCVFRGLGPRKPNANGVDSGILGRWPVHFHHCHDGSRGSVVEGVVIREAGSFAFVPHSSHGITATEVICFDVDGTPFWWDRADQTDDLLLDRCIAANVHAVGDRSARFSTGSTSGFLAGKSAPYTATFRDCVAVGVLPDLEQEHNAAGFHFTGAGTRDQPWVTEGTNVVHNCSKNGFRIWHNAQPIDRAHTLTGGVAYNIRKLALEAGAYGTPYWHYDNLTIHGTISIHALPAENREPNRPDGYRMSFENIRSYPSANDSWLHIPRHVKPTDFPVLVKDVVVHGSLTVTVTEDDEGVNAGMFDLVNVRDAQGVSITPADVNIITAGPGFRFRIQRADGKSWSVDHEGVATEISPFYPMS